MRLAKVSLVCLGQQAIGEVFGGHSNLDKVYHGVATMVKNG
jgi:anthranilate/para-aminobenzoate synthase component II